MRPPIDLSVVRECLILHRDGGKLAATVNVASHSWAWVRSELLDWKRAFCSRNRQHCICNVPSMHTFPGVEVLELALHSMSQLRQVQAFADYIAPRLAIHEVTLDLRVTLEDFEQGNESLNDVDFAGMTFIKRIGNNFLQGCSNLHRVKTQGLSSVTSIGSSFLSYCPRLTTFDSAGFTALTQVGDFLLQG